LNLPICAGKFVSVPSATAGSKSNESAVSFCKTLKAHERRNVRARSSQEQQGMTRAVANSVQFVKLHPRQLYRDRIGQAFTGSEFAVGIPELNF
jgi:hypothetical protein